MKDTINIGDMLYDPESEKDLVGWVIVKGDFSRYCRVEWNDGCTMALHSDAIRKLKKNSRELKKQFDTL